ncbi:hypothetical protein LIER_13752 [Lithospermum erythrorhizon]|uniref:Transmembrane protein n=1 Tax=Lithospermum erythrorhizon TaxID=34254 RepID=A0AAV3Q1U6_LITER
MKMSTYVSIAFFSVLILFSQIDSIVTMRNFPSSVPSTMISKDYGTLKPVMINKKHHVFSGKEVKNCKPKGVRHASAPSRFANVHPLSYSGCFTGKHGKKP